MKAEKSENLLRLLLQCSSDILTLGSFKKRNCFSSWWGKEMERSPKSGLQISRIGQDKENQATKEVGGEMKGKLVCRHFMDNS